VRGLAQIINDFALAGDNLQRRLKNLVVIESNRLFGVLLFRLSTFLRALFLLSFLATGRVLAGQANANRLFGRSMTWPMDALTVKLRPNTC
jgi:hypothetical protein